MTDLGSRNVDEAIMQAPEAPRQRAWPECRGQTSRDRLEGSPGRRTPLTPSCPPSLDWALAHPKRHP